MRTLVYMLIGLILTGLSACKSLPASSSDSLINIKDSTVINIKDSIRIIEKIEQKDSVVTKDSVIYIVDENGNVLRSEYYKLKETYKDSQKELNTWRAKYDSLLRISDRQDSTVVRKPYPVEKELSLWQKFKIGVGEIALLIIIVLLVYIKFK